MVVERIINLCLQRHNKNNNKMKTDKVIYGIGMLTVYGNYKTFTKEFNDERHFNNWYDYMINKGHKIVGVYDADSKNELNK